MVPFGEQLIEMHSGMPTIKRMRATVMHDAGAVMEPPFDE